VRGALALALAATGCLDTLGPDVGPPLRAACSNEDSDPATAVHFATDLQSAVFSRVVTGCVRCHTPGGVTPIGLQISGLDLSSYATLRAGGIQSEMTIVVPGEPCASVLLQKIGTAPPFGARMPLDGPPYLDARDIQMVADWIAEGANDD
jgi:hypothetical protein